MQKWLPDAFASEPAPAVLPREKSSFESDQSAAPDAQGNRSHLFVSESGLSAPDKIMNHLTPEERAQVFELVEQDIKRDYETREQELRQQFTADLDKNRLAFDEALAAYVENISRSVTANLKESADESARLAVQLAEKIIRQQVKIDHYTLVRAMETTHFKIEGAREVTVCVSPEEAGWLNGHPEVCERLGIHKVVADRRVDSGGCLVKTEKREWDATVKGQLDFLGELVEEMINTAAEPDLSVTGEADDEQGLD